jgi:hypothetical protein
VKEKDVLPLPALGFELAGVFANVGCHSSSVDLLASFVQHSIV